MFLRTKVHCEKLIKTSKKLGHGGHANGCALYFVEGEGPTSGFTPQANDRCDRECARQHSSLRTPAISLRCPRRGYLIHLPTGMHRLPVRCQYLACLQELQAHRIIVITTVAHSHYAHHRRSST